MFVEVGLQLRGKESWKHNRVKEGVENNAVLSYGDILDTDKQVIMVSRKGLQNFRILDSEIFTVLMLLEDRLLVLSTSHAAKDSLRMVCACRGRSVCSQCDHNSEQNYENEDKEETICWEVEVVAGASATNIIRKIYYEHEKDKVSIPTLASLQKAVREASDLSNVAVKQEKIPLYGYVVKFHKVDIARERKRQQDGDNEKYDDMISSDEIGNDYESENSLDFTPTSGMYFTGQGDQVYCMGGEERDLTACDIDCGYCGRCGY